MRLCQLLLEYTLVNNPVQERILSTAQSLWQFFIDRDKERGLDSSRSERDYLGVFGFSG